MNWTAEKPHKAVTLINVKLPPTRIAEQWFLLTADRHWDNPQSDHKLQIQHLEEARKRGAGVIDVGDLFCAMQGKYDKRSSKESVRPEHQTNNYLDSLVDTAAEFFKPYADLFAVIGEGNHETAIRKRHETHLIERLISRLNAGGGSIHFGGYSGWVRFRFFCDSPSGKSHKRSMNLWYHHGFGGGGPVTKGVIQTNRRAVFLPDANIVVGGHIHEHWVFPIQRARLSQSNRTYHDTQWHVTLPTYKDEYADGDGGWHVEQGRPPKPVGGVWMRFFRDKHDDIKVAFEWAQ